MMTRTWNHTTFGSYNTLVAADMVCESIDARNHADDWCQYRIERSARRHVLVVATHRDTQATEALRKLTQVELADLMGYSIAFENAVRHLLPKEERSA